MRIILDTNSVSFKQEFVLLISEIVKANPEWLGDIVMGMQHGLANALAIERGKVTDLAMGLDFMREKHPKTFARYMHKLQHAIVTLYKYFETAPCGKEIAVYLETDENR